MRKPKNMIGLTNRFVEGSFLYNEFVTAFLGNGDYPI